MGRSRKAKALPTISKLLTKTPNRILTYCSLTVFLFALIGVPQLNIDDSPLEIFPNSHQLRQSGEYFSESRGWRANVSLISENFELTESVTQKLIDSDFWKKDYKNLKLEDPWTTVNYVQSDISSESRRSTDQTILNSPQMIRYLNDYGEARSIIYIDNTDVSYINKLKQNFEEFCQANNCKLAGTLISYGEFGTKVPKTLMSSLFISILLVSLVLLLLAKSQGISRHGRVAIVVSALWGPAFVISFLWVMQVQIYFVTCIFASVLVGLAGDNAIQFIFSSKKKGLNSGLTEKQTSSFQTGLILMILPCVFLLSFFLPMRILGIFFALGTLASLYGDIWILKGLLKLKPTQNG